MPVAPRVATSPTTIMIAERIAEAVYATDGTLGGVPVLEIAAPGGRGRWLAQSPEPGDRRSPWWPLASGAPDQPVSCRDPGFPGAIYIKEDQP